MPSGRRPGESRGQPVAHELRAHTCLQAPLGLGGGLASLLSTTQRERVHQTLQRKHLACCLQTRINGCTRKAPRGRRGERSRRASAPPCCLSASQALTSEARRPGSAALRSRRSGACRCSPPGGSLHRRGFTLGCFACSAASDQRTQRQPFRAGGNCWDAGVPPAVTPRLQSFSWYDKIFKTKTLN